MKFHYLLPIIMMLGCQQSQPEIVMTCDLIDMGEIGYTLDSLRENGWHDKAAQLYFNAGETNHSSELFVYAAWQFGEGGNIDSALIAVQRALDFGMSNPYVLQELGIENDQGDRDLRSIVDQRLGQIKDQNSSIDNFEIIATPTNDFWTFFDKAVQDTVNAKKYLSAFICKGSNAVRDYYHIRYESVDNMYQTMIVENSEYFKYVKNVVSGDELAIVSKEVQQMMVKFSNIYPKAVYPKVYLIPSLINSSGTLTELGLYIGVDMFAKSDSMPLSNLNDWQRDHIANIGEMKYHLIHELMHFQQSYQDTDKKEILLGKLIEEGACDFLTTLTVNGQMSASMKKNLAYLNDPKNLAFILDELKRDIYGTDLSKWMYNGGGIEDRPSDLGYSVGYLICKSYYEKSANKEKAIVELLNTNNFSKVIKESEFKDIL